VGASKKSGTWILSDEMNGTEEFLREIVDACASSVAVLDESGTILYASKSWQLFERAYERNADTKAQPPDVFAHCLRVDDDAISNNARVNTLSDRFSVVSGNRKSFREPIRILISPGRFWCGPPV
jgi:hypothetical protein